MKLKNIFKQWKEYQSFQNLHASKKRIVFYAEDNSSWVYFEPIIKALIMQGHIVNYVISSKPDQSLENLSSNLNIFWIGERSLRTIFFKTLESDVVIMTMPDLNTFYIKRSIHPVHYIYVHHSLVSTHMVYRKNAFDHFDTIFCCGPHHLNEIRKHESQLGLKAKNLVSHGYGRLDSILAQAKRKPEANKITRVLLAPSWGENGILERIGSKVVEVLLGTGLHVTVRPHPMTLKTQPSCINELRKIFSNKSNFVLETDIRSMDSLVDSDVLISDWSGVALEYAFGLEKPVLFIDTPRKVNNPDYNEINVEPIEIWIRNKIGRVISPTDIKKIPDTIKNFLDKTNEFKEAIIGARNKWVFNIGNSGVIGAGYIGHGVKSQHSSLTK